MKRKLLFLMMTALLLAPWPVAYAYGSDAGSPADVTIAAPEAAPQMNAFGQAIGGIIPGDLFYVDSIGNQADIPITIYLTNTDELVHSYRYLNLNIGIYAQTQTSWEKAIAGSGEPLHDIYITMQNGRTSFTLPGCQYYKITLDRGCFYCYVTADGEESVRPEFYLTLE